MSATAITGPRIGRPRVAVVVGSGGLKCVAAIGAINVLQREGIPIDMAVGCSGGSLCATWLARGGGDADDQADRFVRSLRGMFESIDYAAIGRALVPRLFDFSPDFALLDDRKINAAVAAFAGADSFEDMKLPLHIVATDFATGEKVVLSSGPLRDAIRASIAIPLMLKPWAVGGRRLTDGGASDPLPVDVAMREGADVIVAMGFEEALQPEFRNALQLMLHLKSTTVNHLLRSQYAFYSLSHHAEVIPILPVFERRIGLNDFHEVPHLIRQGEVAAEREIPYLRRLLGLQAGEAGGAR
jgi:NTE family protein